MLSGVGVRRLLALVLGCVGLGVAPAVWATTVTGLGLDDGWACPAGSATCSDNSDFVVVPASATGTITLTPTGATTWSVDITLTVSNLTMPNTGGPIDGVDSLLFTSTTYTVIGWSAMDFGDGNATGLGAVTGQVAGSYEQLDGSSTTVVGPTPIDQSVLFSNLVCDPNGGVGQCGFQVGFFDDFVLPIGVTGGGTNYEINHTFNVLIPEPSTAALLLFGLLSFSLRRRA
jgi:hypothetical protein